MTAVTTRLSIQGLGWERLTRLRDALDLVAAIREMKDPFASPEDFRRLLTLVVRLAEQFGLEPSWLERWESLLNDDRLTQVVLAVAQYVLGILNGRERTVSPQSTQPVVVGAQLYAEWLPLVLELLRVVLSLRGAQ
jgi:hypothetical protein